MSDEEHSELAPTTREETALDVAATLTSVVPWLGGPLSEVLSGISIRRKMDRVREMLDGLAEELREFRSDLSEHYVRTDEFKELFERVLRTGAEERNTAKRRLYRKFLVSTVKLARNMYDDQMAFLRTLEIIGEAHVLVMKALIVDPEPNPGSLGSPLQTLCRRLPEIPRAVIEQVISELNNLGLTSLQSLTTMMTGHGAANLRHALTPYGARFITYLLQDE